VEKCLAKVVQNTLMDIFRWELFRKILEYLLQLDGENAVTLYKPPIHKLDMFIPFAGNLVSKFFQNSLFLIFDKFRLDYYGFDDAYYFRVVNFMKRLSMYKRDINRSYLRAYLFNNTITYLEYKTTFTLKETGIYYTYFKPLRPTRDKVEAAMSNLYADIAKLAGHL